MSFTWYNSLMNVIEFKEACLKMGLVLSDLQLEQYEKYYQLLNEWNKVMNLTGIDEHDEVYEKHFYDSLLSIENIKYEGSLVDVGSGAGFPGLVLKIAYPDLFVTLLEPIGKRCRFLQAVIDELGLQKIEVVNERSEDFAKSKRESYDFVTARAVSNLNILSELCVPLIKVGGHFIVLRGSSGSEEIVNAKEALKALGAKEVSVFEKELNDGSKRIIADYVKVKATNLKYPRNYGMIKKRPL